MINPILQSKPFEALEFKTLYVIITDPSSGEVEFKRKLRGNQIVDARRFADRYAASVDAEIDDSDGYIPDCSGDIRVEFMADPENPRRIWSAESFYFKRY